jgi:uncharacterized protein YdaU (DUF1376 family)
VGKAPAFQTYSADYYMDTNSWTVEEMGIYQRLLLTEWVNGGLPNDPTRLARIAGCGVKKFSAGWGTIQVKFHPNGNGLLINERLESERKKQLKYRELQSIKGKQSAKSRSTTVEPKPQPEGNSSVFSLQSSKKNIYIGKFKKPSLEEITAYCQERKNQVNPQQFLDHYESNGWLVGKNKMKDWKAAVRTWEKNDFKQGGSKQDRPAAHHDPFGVCPKCKQEALKTDINSIDVGNKKYCPHCPEVNNMRERKERVDALVDSIGGKI